MRQFFAMIRGISSAFLLLNLYIYTSALCRRLPIYGSKSLEYLPSVKRFLISGEVDIDGDQKTDCGYESKSITEEGPPNMKYHLPSINLSFPGIRVINSNPPVFEIDDFLTPQQCHALIEQALSSKSLGGLGVSQTFSGSSAVSSRTSSTCHLPKEAVGELLQKVELLTGMPTSHFEEAQVCRYTAGQQYSWHYDSIPILFRKGWGNRLATLIVYLNDLPVSSGGATAFRHLGLQVQPEIGKALLFFPSYIDGSQDDRALHSGVITTDLKWIANIWVHEASYDSMDETEDESLVR